MINFAWGYILADLINGGFVIGCGLIAAVLVGIANYRSTLDRGK